MYIYIYYTINPTIIGATNQMNPHHPIWASPHRALQQPLSLSQPLAVLEQPALLRHQWRLRRKNRNSVTPKMVGLQWDLWGGIFGDFRGFHSHGGTPKCMWIFLENPLKMDALGVPLSWETSKFWSFFYGISSPKDGGGVLVQAAKSRSCPTRKWCMTNGYDMV